LEVTRLSYEGAPRNVLVNSIAPGPVETGVLASLSDEWRAMKKVQLPVGRLGHVDEIAPPRCFSPPRSEAVISSGKPYRRTGATSCCYRLDSYA